MKDCSSPEPTAATLADIVIARARSRLVVTEITAEYRFGLLSIFRDEISGSVACASAFLVALAASENYELDALAWSIRPPRGWPFRSMAFAGQDRRTRPHHASKGSAYGKPNVIIRSGVGPVFPLRDGGRARVLVTQDCMDVSATTGGVRLVSTRGVLRVTVPWAVPRSVDSASIDRPLSDVVNLMLLADRDWTIVAVERSSTSQGCTFVAHVGSRPYVLPWKPAI